MSVVTNESTVAAPVAVPVKDILPWAVLGGVIVLMAYYFVGAEGGAMSSLGWYDGP